MKWFLASGVAALLFFAALPRIAPAQVPVPGIGGGGGGGGTPRFTLEPRVWFPRLKGDITVIDNGIGEKVDFDDDLGLDDRELAPGGRFSLRVGEKSHIRIGYHRLEFEGRRTVERSIEFDGTIFDLSQGVRSELELDLFEAEFRTPIYGNEGFDLLVSLGVEAMNLDASLRGTEALSGERAKESVSELIPYPTVGLALVSAPTSRIGLFVEARGLTIGSAGNVLDAEAGLNIQLTRRVLLTGGYRLLRFDADIDDVEGDFQLDGGFAAITLRL